MATNTPNTPGMPGTGTPVQIIESASGPAGLVVPDLIPMTPPLSHFVRTIHSGSFYSASNVLILNIHTTSQWSHDLMIDSRLFENLELGDIVEIKAAGRHASTSFTDTSSGARMTVPDSGSEAGDSEGSYDTGDFTAYPYGTASPTGPSSQSVLTGTEADEAATSGDGSVANLVLMEVTTLDPPLGRVQISIKANIADEFRLPRFTPVRISKLSPNSAAKYESALVEISFRGRYLSNGDLWLIKNALKGKPVYVGKVVRMLGVKLKVDQIHHILPEGGVDEKKKAKYGIISKRTRFVFRSGSAQIFWLIQCSVEMWGFADDGELMVERLFGKFIPDILDRWNATNAKHSLTVIFFTRTVYNGIPENSSLPTSLNRFPNLDDTRRYVDFYHVAMANVTRTDWKTLIGPLQDAFHAFPKRANWATKHGAAVCGLPSLAQEGNILEAINLSLNAMQNQHVDRDLARTGQLMVVMTAGTGVFEVDWRLGRLTKDRMTNHAVGCDVISLTQPPPHIVPLFVHNPCYFNSDGRAVVYEFDQPHPFSSSNWAALQQQLDALAPENNKGSSSTINSPTFGSPLRSSGVFDTSGASPPPGSSTTQDAPRIQKNRIPLFSIPYWINLSHPFHKATTEFQPVFENRMFPIPEPNRSAFPISLVAPLERARQNKTYDLDLTAQVSTWAISRSIPLRDEMRPWFPLVADLTSFKPPISSSTGWSKAWMSSLREAIPVAPQTAASVSLSETKKTLSPMRKNVTGGGVSKVMSSMNISTGGYGNLPHFQRSTSTNLSANAGLANVTSPRIFATHSGQTSGSVSGTTERQPLMSRSSGMPHRLEPSPSLVALQLFTGGMPDRSQPRVSWIDPVGSASSSQFSLPPSSTAGGPKSRTMTGLDTVSAPSSRVNLGMLTTAASSAGVSSTHVLHFDSGDETAIRARQKRHDHQVFAPTHSSSSASYNSIPGSANSSASKKKISSGMTPAMQPQLFKQSVNDLAALAMTPSMGNKPPRYPPGGAVSLPGSSMASSRRRRGTSDVVFTGLDVKMPQISMDRTSSLTSTKSYDDGDNSYESPSSHASSSSSFSSTLAPPLPLPAMIPSTASGTSANATGSSSGPSSHSSAYAHFVNPFQLDSLMRWYCDRPSHSRSRWLHLFPNSRLDGLRLEALEIPTSDGPPSIASSIGNIGVKEDDRAEQAVGEVNWKSLLTPAMMPLTTGFAPSAESLKLNYSMATYSLVGSTNMDQLLSDIICQRLAEDFQLYDPEDFTTPSEKDKTAANRPPDLNTAGNYSPRASGSLFSPRGVFASTSQGSSPAGSLKQQFTGLGSARKGVSSLGSGTSTVMFAKDNYVLTIGHHVHVLSYSPKLMKLDVMTFARDQNKDERFGSDNPVEYKFLLWDGDFEETVIASRFFQDESASEYSWSYVDNLLMGESIEFLPGSEFFFRFKRLTFCLFSESSVRKLLEYLHAKAVDSEDHNIVTHHEDEQVKDWPFNQVQFEAGWGERAGLDVKVLKGPTVELDLDGPFPQSEGLRPREWLYVNLDDRFHPDRTFHVDIRWMVASGEAVFRFIEDCKNKLGDDSLVQVANYCLTFDDHSFVVPRRVQLAGKHTLRSVCAALVGSKLMNLDSYSVAQQALVLIRKVEPAGSVLCRVSLIDDDNEDGEEDRGDDNYSDDEDTGDASVKGSLDRRTKRKFSPVVLDFLVNPFVSCLDYPAFIAQIVAILG